MYEAISTAGSELGKRTNSRLPRMLRWVVTRKNVRDEDLKLYIFNARSVQFNNSMHIVFNVNLLYFIITFIVLLLTSPRP